MTTPISQVLAGAARWHIEQGDSAAVLPSLPACSIDAIVADPPAGIAFMGKAWDGDKGGEEQWIAWLAGILTEGYRVLKPGGHCLLWALPRTSDWTMQALRRAGFEVRDVVTHLFGSGFPKSLDVSKAIDAAAGATREVVGPSGRHVSGKPEQRTDGLCGSSTFAESIGMGSTITAPATPEARRWAGFGTALKPAAEFWILARRPLDGTVAANVLAHGTGALNIDAVRVGTDAGWSYPNGRGGSGWQGRESLSSNLSDPMAATAGRFPANLVLSHTAWEETHCRPCGAVLSFVARFCPECGSAAVEHRRAGCCAVGERVIPRNLIDATAKTTPSQFGAMGGSVSLGTVDETVTAWECLATCPCGLSTLAASGGAPPRCQCGRAMTWACPVARLDEQSGELHSQDPTTRKSANSSGGYLYSLPGNSDGYADAGGASRFFNTFPPPDDAEPFHWEAKPSAAEAEAGCESLPLKSAAENVGREEGSAGLNSPRTGAGRLSGRRNHHPTRKSIALMRHFCRLACPPGGIILDMFAGSGTTIAAAAVEGFRAVGVEMDPEYVAIGRARATFWARLTGTRAATGEKPRPARDKADESGQGRLF